MNRGEPWSDREGGSLRSQRLLVRVLLALRGETRPGGDAMRDAARAELLADRIMRELPRSVLPVGLAALLGLTAYCAIPFLQDFLRATGAVEAPAPMTRVVESGLRERGAALGDGFEVLGSIVAPLIADAPRESDAREAREPERPSDARAPVEDS